MNMKPFFAAVKKHSGGWLFSILLSITVFLGLSWWQQKDMLANGDSVKMPSITLPTLLENDYFLKFNHRQKPTLVYFFAPWCRVCHASIENLEAIHQDQSDTLQIVAIALDWRSESEVSEFVSQHKLSLPVLLGTPKIRSDFQIWAYPSYYLISKDATVVSRNIGYTTELGMRWRLLLNRLMTIF